MVDLHAHILPGLDDGPASIDESIAMARLASRSGISTVVATPHMFNGVHNVSRRDVADATERLAAALDAEGVALRIVPGGEVYLDQDLPDRVRRREVMSLGDGGKFLMVEISPYGVPAYLQELLYETQLAGVTPILVHPERNAGVQRDPDVLVPLVRAGNLLQMTAGSVTGRFGSSARQCAKVLLRRRMAHLVGTDAHDSTDGRFAGLARAREAISGILGDEETGVLFDTNPGNVLSGKLPDVPEPIERIPRRFGKVLAWWKR